MEKALLISGMGNSGTSALSGVLKLGGLDFGDNFIPSNSGHPKGFFEDKEILRINLELCSIFSTWWGDEKMLRAQPNNMRRYEDAKAALVKRINEFKSPFAIKDPRITFFLPMYIEVFKELKIYPILVSMHRDVNETIASLKKRSGFPPLKTLALAMKYKYYLELWGNEVDHLKINFKDLLNDPEDSYNKVAKIISLKPFEEIKKQVYSFLDPELKHF